MGAFVTLIETLKPENYYSGYRGIFEPTYKIFIIVATIHGVHRGGQVTQNPNVGALQETVEKYCL